MTVLFDGETIDARVNLYQKLYYALKNPDRNAMNLLHRGRSQIR